MVGHQQQRGSRRAPATREHRPDNQLVDTFERLDLEIGAAHMTGLVGRLDMQQQEIAALERFESVAGLGGIVGIEKAGRAGHR